MTKLQKKTLIILAPTFPPEIGGPASYALNISEPLSEHFNILLISSYNNKSKKNTNIFPFRHIQFRGFKFLRPFQFLYYTILNLKKDCIVFSTSSPQDTFLSGVISKLTGKKVFFRIGGEYHREITQDNMNITSSSKFKSMFIFIILKILDFFKIGFISVSKSISEYLCKIDITQNIELILNPVRTFSEKKKPLKSNITIVKLLVISRLIKRKKIDEIIDLVRKKQDLELIICGSGPEKDHLIKNAAKIKNKITFKGDIGFEEKKSYFQKADYLVLNSDYGEGMPNVILEALSFGIPVLTTEHVRNTGVVSEKNAFIYRDINEIYDYVMKNTKPENYNLLIEKTFLSDDFTLKTHIRKLTGLFDS